jgi:mevalonate kinase
MKVRTPGKLILSGEHAAVYGHPVLAMAVNRYIDLEITPQSSPMISFDLPELNGQYDLSFSAFASLRSRIRQRYQYFLTGHVKVNTILEHPVELSQFALSLLLEMYQNALSTRIKTDVQSSIPAGIKTGVQSSIPAGIKTDVQSSIPAGIKTDVQSSIPAGIKTDVQSSIPAEIKTDVQSSIPMGIKISVQSSIPMGCGMGSSAVMILSVLFAVANYLQFNMTKDDYYRLALEAETMQHGQSSGIDIQTSLYGGCIYRHVRIFKRARPSLPLYLVNTGTPQSSTGECVMQVAPYFKTSQIGEDFAAVTNELDAALQRTHSTAAFKQAICANHRLLNTIGVVPKKVAHFIQEIQIHGGAAKICGAGAVQGDQAGMVLVIIEDELLLKQITSKHGYDVLPVQCVPEGVHVI